MKIPIANFLAGMFVLWCLMVGSIGTLTELIGFDWGLIVGSSFTIILFSILFYYSTKEKKE